MNQFQIFPLTTVDKGPVNDFLRRMFGPLKGAFLAEQGHWWHQGDQNRNGVMATPQGPVAAYFATTPMFCRLNGQQTASLWWIDLIVDPDFRRAGLQTLMDEAVRTRPGLKFGIPNPFHATILERHGWAIRHDFQKRMLPLYPGQIRAVQKSAGRKGQLLRFAARLANPLFALLRDRWRRYQPRQARQITAPTPQLLAGLFARYADQTTLTAWRDEAFFQWRYFDCPYRQELAFYTAGPEEQPTHYAITRFANFRGLKTVRILDIFGDFSGRDTLSDLLRLIIKEAIQQQADQVTVLSSQSAYPALPAALQRCGFLFQVPIYFCWHTPNTPLMSQLAHTPAYWTLADSDNDEAH